jgi:hypothetical protein
MFDRYDPRIDARDDARDGGRALSRGSRGAGDAQDVRDRYHGDVFTNGLDLPRGREREPVRDRDRAYEIDGGESRMLATVGAFRVASDSDLRDPREDVNACTAFLNAGSFFPSDPRPRVEDGGRNDGGPARSERSDAASELPNG